MFERGRRVALGLVFAVASLAALAALAEQAPLATVKSLDAKRYPGTWHRIALIPNVFQRKCTRDTGAEVAAGDDGEISVRNRCPNAEGGMEWVTGAARRLDVAFALTGP